MATTDGTALRILLAASEVTGFAKTGGLADVCAALPRALARRGHRVAVVTPFYHAVRARELPLTPLPQPLDIPVGGRTVGGRLLRGTLPDSDVPVYFVEQPEFFGRDDPTQGRGLYQYTAPGGARRDYPDNAERFLFFARAVLEAMPLLDGFPQVLHANDWQTGLAPVFLSESYAHRPAYAAVRSLFTVHNIAYQGNFPSAAMGLTGLDARLFNHLQLEFYGQLSFLKGGIVFADRISTVSPSYAQEIQTRAFGCGLEGVLAELRGRLTGIVNGVDYADWNPATDPLLAANYGPETVAEGKPVCKAALQSALGLPAEPQTPVLGVIARLVEQKGISLVTQAAEQLLGEGVQLVVLGEGDPEYHRQLHRLQERFPSQVGLALFFDETLAHRIEAGADVFLMPSLYEPSGLNQLYSLKYGTVPVVRATGGLADTIVDATEENLAADRATGFCFGPHTVGTFLAAVRRALGLYRQHPDRWLRLVRTGMHQDWSWDRSAAAYEALYRSMLG
jgi:starch synthase